MAGGGNSALIWYQLSPGSAVEDCTRGSDVAPHLVCSIGGGACWVSGCSRLWHMWFTMQMRVRISLHSSSSRHLGWRTLELFEVAGHRRFGAVGSVLLAGHWAEDMNRDTVSSYYEVTKNIN